MKREYFVSDWSLCPAPCFPLPGTVSVLPHTAKYPMWNDVSGGTNAYWQPSDPGFIPALPSSEHRQLSLLS